MYSRGLCGAHPFGCSPQNGVHRMDDQRYPAERGTCTYLPALESYNRASYIGIVLPRTESKVEQEYVLQSLGDRSADIRDEAYKVLSEMSLSPNSISI